MQLSSSLRKNFKGMTTIEDLTSLLLLLLSRIFAFPLHLFLSFIIDLFRAAAAATFLTRALTQTFVH
jgi:hypothetical protein